MAAPSASDNTQWTHPPNFTRLNDYGWTYDASFTVDENYLDLACLIARNSIAKDGHMGCVLVRGVTAGSGGALVSETPGDIVLSTINSSLLGPYRSDNHAEANAVTECAVRGVSSRGTSVYVTRSPCKACYNLLASAGICRIISPQPLDSPDTTASASAMGIEVVVLRDTDARAKRRNHLGSSGEDMERVRALREERKRMRKDRSHGKKAIRSIEAAGSSTEAAGSSAVSDCGPGDVEQGGAQAMEQDPGTQAMEQAGGGGDGAAAGDGHLAGGGHACVM